MSYLVSFVTFGLLRYTTPPITRLSDGGGGGGGGVGGVGGCLTRVARAGDVMVTLMVVMLV